VFNSITWVPRRSKPLILAAAKKLHPKEREEVSYVKLGSHIFGHRVDRCGIAGQAAGIAQVLFFVFLVLFLISLIVPRLRPPVA
jgi:uncharacterized membrane protein YtjA (UPF0391 family)